MNTHRNNFTEHDDKHVKRILYQSDFTHSRKSSTSEPPLDGRHTHHIGYFEPRVGFLEIFRFMLRSRPQTIESAAPGQARLQPQPDQENVDPKSQNTYVKLPFQREQIVVLRSQEEEGHHHSNSCSTSLQSNHCSTSSFHATSAFHHNILYPNDFHQPDLSISLIYKIIYKIMTITNYIIDSDDDNSIVESQPEFELNQFFDNDNDISMSMWLEEQGVHGVQEIQGG